MSEPHPVWASSFADPKDVAAFRRCKAQRSHRTKDGKLVIHTDDYCFGLGDNGVGCWGDDTTGSDPMCALPPEDMTERWGSPKAARHRLVIVTANGRTVVCTLADRMPARRNIRNGCGIDLNPAACAALGLVPPIRVRATWRWKEEAA
ncbi:MAG TPA: hypothetical protein PLU30_23545 [Verrucomicrobiae bacterium]|nr:hypothetical protein [Verrucomicrobiae bacterium]